MNPNQLAEDKLVAAVNGLAQELHQIRVQAPLVTAHDLEKAEARILAAIKAATEPGSEKDLKEITKDLKTSEERLKRAIAHDSGVPPATT